MVVIIDYGMGNLGSILNMLEYLGIDAVASRDPTAIASADRLILPGVGAFDRGMRSLRDFALIEPLREAVVERKIPLLGICLGMQLITRSSEEGTEPGLGWIEAKTIRIRPPAGADLKVPHVGWSEVAVEHPSILFDVSQPPQRFYFTHSYHVVCDRAEDAAASCHYGISLTCAVSHGSIHGVQFHPEKSHLFGMTLLRRFAGEA